MRGDAGAAARRRIGLFLELARGRAFLHECLDHSGCTFAGERGVMRRIAVSTAGYRDFRWREIADGSGNRIDDSLSVLCQSGAVRVEIDKIAARLFELRAAGCERRKDEQNKESGRRGAQHSQSPSWTMCPSVVTAILICAPSFVTVPCQVLSQPLRKFCGFVYPALVSLARISSMVVLSRGVPGSHAA